MGVLLHLQLQFGHAMQRPKGGGVIRRRSKRRWCEECDHRPRDGGILEQCVNCKGLGVARVWLSSFAWVRLDEGLTRGPHPVWACFVTVPFPWSP